VIELETGGVDVVEAVSPQAAARLAAGGKVTIARVQGRLIGQVQWNLREDLFADRRVRRALSLAIDRSAFVDGLLQGYGTPAASPIPPALWAHDPDLRPDAYDPAGARALLAAAGWVDTDGDGVRERQGRRFSFTLLTRQGDPVRENGAAIIRENLKAVGVEVLPRAMELGAAIDAVRRGQFEAYLGVYAARLWVDPSPLLRSDAVDRFNYGAYANASVDSLLDRGLACADREAARAVWRRLQAVVAADEPIAFLYYPDMIVGIGPRLRGVRPHILSPYNNLADWWIAPADRRDAFPSPEAGPR